VPTPYNKMLRAEAILLLWAFRHNDCSVEF
jgi:hypothetical protein